MNLDIVVFGLSITSSWGNGHASTYRSLIKALASRGHRITFIERDMPWYRPHRDVRDPSYCRVELYRDLGELARYAPLVRDADLVVQGSYVPDGIVLAEWITSYARGVTAFYDIDTPVTLAKLDSGGVDYIAAHQIPRFDLFLSFTGGPTLRHIEERYGSSRARALYCAADLDFHAPAEADDQWALGYLGTYSADRDAALNELLVKPATQFSEWRFVVAGAQYPDELRWPANIERLEHIAPAGHAAFYAAQRFTLNVTRVDMVKRGYSPSVRLFEAAACGTPIISDHWPGIETFFAPDDEILIAKDSGDVARMLSGIADERRRAIATAARKRLRRSHTADHRAKDLEQFYLEALDHADADADEVVA
jgi:spore maturation protein CgeB